MKGMEGKDDKIRCWGRTKFSDIVFMLKASQLLYGLVSCVELALHLALRHPKLV